MLQLTKKIQIEKIYDVVFLIFTILRYILMDIKESESWSRRVPKKAKYQNVQ